MSGKDVPSDWKGKICIFLSAVSLALILALMAALAALIAGNSLVALWPEGLNARRLLMEQRCLGVGSTRMCPPMAGSAFSSRLETGNATAARIFSGFLLKTLLQANSRRMP